MYSNGHNLVLFNNPFFTFDFEFQPFYHSNFHSKLSKHMIQFSCTIIQSISRSQLDLGHALPQFHIQQSQRTEHNRTINHLSNGIYTTQPPLR